MNSSAPWVALSTLEQSQSRWRCYYQLGFWSTLICSRCNQVTRKPSRSAHIHISVHIQADFVWLFGLLLRNRKETHGSVVQPSPEVVFSLAKKFDLLKQTGPSVTKAHSCFVTFKYNDAPRLLQARLTQKILARVNLETKWCIFFLPTNSVRLCNSVCMCVCVYGGVTRNNLTFVTSFRGFTRTKKRLLTLSNNLRVTLSTLTWEGALDRKLSSDHSRNAVTNLNKDY